MNDSTLLLSLVKYVLPSELVSSFELVDIKEENETLHLSLDELNIIPDEYQSMCLTASGFYESSTIKDFPLRDRKVILHLLLRRWIDESGKSYSRTWDLTASGTRYSKEFAYFLKEAFGYLPDTSPIS